MTYDHNGKEIHISIHRYVTGIPQVPAEGLSFPNLTNVG